MVRISKSNLLWFVFFTSVAAAIWYLLPPITVTRVPVPEGYELKCYAVQRPVPLKIEVTK